MIELEAPRHLFLQSLPDFRTDFRTTKIVVIVMPDAHLLLPFNLDLVSLDQSQIAEKAIVFLGDGSFAMNVECDLLERCVLSKQLKGLQEMVVRSEFASTIFFPSGISELKLDTSQLCNIPCSYSSKESSNVLPTNLFPFRLPIISSFLITTNEAELMLAIKELPGFLIHLLASPEQCGVVAKVLGESEVDVFVVGVDYRTFIDIVPKLCW